MEIVSENSGEIQRGIVNVSCSIGFALDRPIDRLRVTAGALSKNDRRQSHVGLAKCMPECIAWVRMEKRIRNFDEIAKSIGYS